MSYPGQRYHHQGQGQYGNQGGMPGAPQGYPQPGYGNYAPPQGPPGGYGGYGAPSGPPPQQYGAPSGPPPQGYQQQQSGYNPNGGYRQQGGGGPPPAYANMPVNHIPQGAQMSDGHRFQYSAMNGKRKALLIGINYTGTSAELRGCWNDVDNIRRFLLARGYKEDDMVVLTDRASDPRSVPTRQNMTAAMHWLVRGAQPGDALFFQYSGHGGQAKATQGDEADGMNETILPLDFQSTGQMEDDELHAIMVRPLPMGCRLTAIFDSCHSGTALDLPYVYATSGNIKEPNVVAGVGKGLMGAAMNYAQGNIGGMLKGLMGTFNEARNTESAEAFTKANRSSPADVVMLSGCKDAQTSADAVEAGKATGAMSWAFIEVLTQYPRLSYLQLLNATRDLLASKYSQKPQLSSSHPIDLNMEFTI
ncbi:unnamed protein product [Parajaminaea phylloscopi]